MKKIEVSVIILTYFHEEYIENCLKSVFKQICDFEYEILVFDDCSKDNTINIAKKYLDGSSFVNIFTHEENVGTTKNLYEAFTKARGKYIVILAGDDCFIDECKLQKQHDFLENHNDYVAVSTALQVIFTDGSKGEIYPQKKYFNSDFTIDNFISGDNYVEQGIMLRNIFFMEEARIQFRKMYEFSRLIEDLTLCFFLFDYGKVFVLPDITYALTARKSTDQNQYNYNSTHNFIENVSEHIFLLNNIDSYYEKYDLQYRYQPIVISIILYLIKSKDVNSVEILKEVPFKYLIKSIFKGIPKCIIEKVKI